MGTTMWELGIPQKLYIEKELGKSIGVPEGLRRAAEHDCLPHGLLLLTGAAISATHFVVEQPLSLGKCLLLALSAIYAHPRFRETCQVWVGWGANKRRGIDERRLKGGLGRPENIRPFWPRPLGPHWLWPGE